MSAPRPPEAASSPASPEVAPRRPPTVHTFPLADAMFRAAVEVLVRRAVPRSLAELETELRILYPAASVRPRQVEGERDVVWYAFRDGIYRGEPETRWITEPGTAWARIDPRTGLITDANAELAVLFARAGERLIGRSVTEFIVAGTDDVSAAQMAEVLRGRPVHSHGLAPGPDGGTVLVEYVAQLTDDEIEAWYRAV